MMSKPKRSYKDLEAEIARLREQQEALKEAKVEIFLREFRKKAFQEKLLDVDDGVLKLVAKEFISKFDTFVERAENRNNGGDATVPETVKPSLGSAASPGVGTGFSSGTT